MGVASISSGDAKSMNADANSTRMTNALLGGTLVVLAMWAAAEALKPIALAVLLAFLLAPAVARLERWGVPRVASIALVLILLTAALGGTAFIVGGQVASLAEELSSYRENIQTKLARLKPSGESPVSKIISTADELVESMQSTEERSAISVRIVSGFTSLEQFHSVMGPVEAVAAMIGIVLLLVVFLLLQREDIGNRITQLFGWGQMGVTTKTLAEIGASLSRYLVALALVNTGFGLSIAIGLWIIGVPSPALWGFLAGILRFIPYVGTVIALALPTLMAIAQPNGWWQPVLVLALFALMELVVNSIEPFLYGKSAGVSPVGLLVSALFWTWLWGGLGLFLTNALTVCLAVAGRLIPGLEFLDTLLRHDVKVTEDVRWYQRALNRDQDGALAVLDDALKAASFQEVCDQIIIPNLSRAEHDRSRKFIDNRDVAFIWRVVREWLDDLAERDGYALTPPPAPESTKVPAADPTQEIPRRPDFGDPETAPLIGIATGGGADALTIRMLNFLLKPSGLRVAVLTSTGGSSLQISDKVGSLNPALVLISHLPPGGLTRARYLTRRLRGQYHNLPVVFGYWDPKIETARVVETLRPASANRVVVSLASARELILNLHQSSVNVPVESSR